MRTGSPPITKTIGMIEVAAFAARIVGVPAVGVIVHAVGGAGQVRRIVELRDSCAERVNPAGRDDVARQRLAAIEASGSRGDGVGIVDLIPRTQRQQA